MLKLNSVNQVEGGTELFNEGDKPECSYMLIKGKAELYTKGMLVAVGAGNLLGANGIENGEYICSCRIKEASTVYAFSIEGSNPLLRIITSNKEYSGITIYNRCRLISQLGIIYNELTEAAHLLYNELKNQYKFYVDQMKQSGCRAPLMPEIVQLTDFEPELEIDNDKLEYYKELAKMPFDVVKAYYNASEYMAMTHLHEQFLLEGMMIDACDGVADYVVWAFMLLVGDEDNSLFRNMIGLAISMQKQKFETTELSKEIEKSYAYILKIKTLITEHTGKGWGVDDEKLEYLHDCYVDGQDINEGENGSDVLGVAAADLASLKNSMSQIMEFSSYPEEKCKAFTDLISQFKELPDKNSADDSIRRLRRDIAENYYELYCLAFCATYKSKGSVPRAVELFLDFGLLDETLLREDQLAELLRLKQTEQAEPCAVYSIREWLDLVYRGQKEPSRNDMGQSYSEVLRDLKKQGKINEAQEKELTTNGAMKLDYEIKNVFKHANRVVNGQLTVFVPMLYEDIFIGEIEKAFVTRQLVNDTVNSILKIDFSVFHREALYVDAENGIEREYQMKQVFPVFIMLPTVGENCCMWQEITGRRRDSEARFMLPQISYSALSDMMVKAFGHFRWDMCKTIQGTNWNNIQIRSLTAEYSDYIQFYKKNRLLSEERREKIKLQIQRGRNNLREVFAIDYVAWVKSEANGAIRMNKVAREIMATYCPFSAEIRSVLVKQPLYEEAFARSLRERLKKVHELELRHKILEKNNIVIPQELMDTLAFYKSK